MPEINMPKLSDTMEEGTIVEWKKKSGDQVKAGEVVAEVESDKATFDLEAESDGVLQILVDQGVPAKIGSPIARIGEAGSPEPAQAKPRPKEPETPPTVAEEREPTQKSAPQRDAPPEAPPRDAPASEAPPEAPSGARPRSRQERGDEDGQQGG